MFVHIMYRQVDSGSRQHGFEDVSVVRKVLVLSLRQFEFFLFFMCLKFKLCFEIKPDVK